MTLRELMRTAQGISCYGLYTRSGAVIDEDPGLIVLMEHMSQDVSRFAVKAVDGRYVRCNVFLDVGDDAKDPTPVSVPHDAMRGQASWPSASEAQRDE